MTANDQPSWTKWYSTWISSWRSSSSRSRVQRMSGGRVTSKGIWVVAAAAHTAFEVTRPPLIRWTLLRLDDEGDLGGRGDQPLGGGAALRLGHAAQVDDRQGDGPRRMDDLHRPAVEGGEAGAQDLVAADDLLQRAVERRGVEGAAEPDRHLEVVGDVAAAGELVEE